MREIREHDHYLSDSARNEAYRRALAEVVSPDARVVDLGAGTGLLGVLAARAGASEVVAVDRGPILDVAAEIARASGHPDIVHRRGSSLDLDLPTADVVVADQLDGLGADAGLFQCFADARRRFLAPDGVLVPGALAVHFAPVEHDDTAGLLTRFTDQREDLDTSPALPWVRNQRYWADLEAEHLLGPAVDGADEPTDEWKSRRVTGSTTISRDGSLVGLGGWWSAQLSPSVRVTNAPGADGRVDRGHQLLPLDAPVPVQAGDVVHVDVRLQDVTGELVWRVRVTRPSSDDGPDDQLTVIDERHSTFHGRLDLGDALAMVRAEDPPRLSPSGMIERMILQLCDGEHSPAEIVDAVMAAHPDRYGSVDEARARVHDVLLRVTEPGGVGAGSDDERAFAEGGRT
jgi:SAM-dependent methyltransferase